MNTLEAFSIIDPYGSVGECAKFTIDDVSDSFILDGVTAANNQYVFSVWLKSDAEGSLTVNGTVFQSSANWAKYETNFVSTGSDLSFIFNAEGVYYLYHPHLELGTKATDWTPSPEDIEQDVSDLEVVTQTMSEAIASLSVNTDSIAASVQTIERNTTETLNGVLTSIDELNKKTELIMDEESVQLAIQDEINKGAGKVVTSTGYTFDENGMTVSKSDSEMTTQITEDGMTVRKNGEDTLVANSNGVDAVNLHATTYLIVGLNSRFEDFGEGRTGCFWIGG
jgi:hypothetical protein